jgi:hypothetical protein
MKCSTEPVIARHIVQELQQENLAAAQRITLLVSENQLLTSEAQQLRQVKYRSLVILDHINNVIQEVQILEENLDPNLTQDHRSIPDGSQHLLQEQSRQFEVWFPLMFLLWALNNASRWSVISCENDFQMQRSRVHGLFTMYGPIY